KISQYRQYAGLFGLLYNATVKNLTVTGFNISFTTDIYTYAGGLAGRYIVSGSENSSSIENCKALNGKINIVSNKYPIYGGGFIGYILVNNTATVNIEECIAEVTCNFTANADISTSTLSAVTIRAGGFIGYLGASNGNINITECAAGKSLDTAITKDREKTSDSNYTGGFIGFAGIDTSGAININRSFALGSAFSSAYGENYSAGFIAYAMASDSATMLVKDCYSTGNVQASSISAANYSAGFVSIISKASFVNCYTTGIVYDNNSKESTCSEFASYIFDYEKLNATFPFFENCYFMAGTVVSGQDFLIIPEIAGIQPDDANNLSSFEGFKNTVWTYVESGYPYPTISAIDYTFPKITAYFYENGNNTKSLNYEIASVVGEVTPKTNAANFSCWSLAPNSADAELETLKITSDVKIYANFKFTVKFAANGNVFQEDYYSYQDIIEFPDPPKLPNDNYYIYKFLHWSNSANGNSISTSDIKVTKNVTYYAIYQALPIIAWDGVSSDEFYDGTGTEDDPYIIENAYQLCYLTQKVFIEDGNYAEAYYKLANNINLAGHDWTPIGSEASPFKGNFDGNGYCIYNFIIKSSRTVYAGVFGYTENANITKTDVLDFSISYENKNANSFAGALIGYMKSTDTSSVSECHSQGSISITNREAVAGGLIGFADADQDANIYISNSHSNTDVKLNSTVSSLAGGITGKFSSYSKGESSISNCLFTGSIEVKSSISSYAGGISGYLFDDFGYIPSLSDSEIVANIKNCISAAKSISIPEGKNVYIGAVCGGVNEKATIANCFSYKDIPSSTTGTVSTLGTEFKDTLAELYSAALVADTALFDTENVWTLVEGKSLKLKSLTSIRDTFYLKESTVEQAKGRISVTLSVSFPDDSDYYILLSAYDSRGKMVAFKAVYETTESDQIKDITIKESNLGSASLITLVPVNAINFSPITEPIEIIPE
ncbi:MAG: InlB B-repeat-containing protein, partial [Clostridia bacterium]|nr:InlB B-repeat-containing protein [Clostridia bacterium]